MGNKESMTKFEKFLEFTNENGVTLRPWQEKAAQDLISAAEQQGERAGRSFLMHWLSLFMGDPYYS